MIIYITAGQRQAHQQAKSFFRHVRNQLRLHRRLPITTLSLVLLAIPRLVIAFLFGCMKSLRDPYLFLAAYFVSFLPSMLVFVVFVLPSTDYRKNFKQMIRQCCSCLRN
jgi:hypothetical protein